MRAATYTRYGGPEVIAITDHARPVPGKGDVLVQVAAAGVTTADWRLRAAAFPGAISLIGGRLMFGVFRPRRPILGNDFAGTVVETGADVTAFAPGDRVFGTRLTGAHAEAICVPETGAIAPIPPGLDPVEAAALPFGGLCALEFLDRYARVEPGERVLIVGASGGVGAYAVQIAAAQGATVTGVASAAHAEFVRGLGATTTFDYAQTAPRDLTGPFDVVFDTIGVLDYTTTAPMLAPGGRFLPLNFGLGDLWKGRLARRAGHRQILRVNGDTRAGLDRLTALIAAGKLRPVIDRVYPLSEIRAAHAHVEGRHRRGAVVVEMSGGAEAA